VTQSQASELTLTVTEVAVRPIQVWIRTAGVIDAARTTVTAEVSSRNARRIKVGQRVRAFSPESRSRMHQATVAAVTTEGETTTVRAALMGRPLEASRYFVLEIVTEDGEFLSVPNEAIIETGGKQVVYVQEDSGSYARKEIQVGVQGELYSQVLGGVNAGDQVVTIGSFFIDAEHRLKGS
jgi:Cu(I)/Ag(I) efflux system membrane fusion protein